MRKTNGGRATGRGTQRMVGFAYNHISLRLALIKLSIKHLVAQFTIQARLIKAELIIVLRDLGLLGQQLRTTVRKTRPHAKRQRKHKR